MLAARTSSPFSPSKSSTRLPNRVPSVTCCCFAFPFSITYTFEMPASVEMASSGTVRQDYPLGKEAGFELAVPVVHKDLYGKGAGGLID